MTYLIKNDGYEYQEFALEIEDFLDLIPNDAPYNFSQLYNFSQHNLSFKDWWQPIDAEFTPIKGSKNAPIPDICQWIGATLVLSEKACNTLRKALEPHGELLPVTCNGKSFYIFNCLEDIRADEQNSEQDIFEGEPVGVKKLAFKSGDIKDKSIFKSSYAKCLDLYCSDNFKQAVKSNDLNGIIFSDNLTREY